MKRYCLLCVLIIFTVITLGQPHMTLAKQAPNKDEVVYAILDDKGQVKDIYVVNSFDMKRGGDFVDYGAYDSVQNLTDLRSIEKQEDEVHFSADAGKFHYEGKLANSNLPWDFQVHYYLDDKEVDASKLAGASGQMKIAIDIEANSELDDVFAAYYVLQVTVTLPIEGTENIVAEGATIASAGNDKQVSFTLLPGDTGGLTTSFTAVDFEMDGIQIAAVPANFAFDFPDTDQMVDEMTSLVGAIAKIHDGTTDLANGLASYHQGTKDLARGSSDFQTGLNEATDEIVHATNEMETAFSEIDEIISELNEIDFDAFLQYMEEIGSLTNNFDEIIAILEQVRDNLEASDAIFDEINNELPTSTISSDDLEALANSDADPEVIALLIEAYEAVQTVREIVESADDNFTEMIGSLNDIIESMKAVRDDVNDLSKMIDSLKAGASIEEQIEEMTEMFTLFKDGMNELRAGMMQLKTGYNDIHKGINELSSGAASLSSGAASLNDGTGKLADATRELPEEMTAEIDERLNNYDFSDFEAESFVSAKNKHIRTVQFVIKTEQIVMVEEDDGADAEPVKKGFWEKLLDLFRF